MSNKKISELVAAEATLSGIIPVSDASGTATNKVTIQSILDAQTLWNIFLPPAPTNLSGTAGNGQVSLTWTAPSVLAQTPITDYIIQYSSNNGSTWTVFSDGVSTSTSATVTGLTNGTVYVFRIAAVNGVGTGPYTPVSSAVTPVGSVAVRYLVVAGGGSGGHNMGGGGGAGGYLTASNFAITIGTQYVVSVGGGATPAGLPSGQTGSNSSFASITALGGGGGGDSAPNGNGLNGGSGGGGSYSGAGGLGTLDQGFDGSAGNPSPYWGGGGGGAGAAASYLDGGAGASSDITGTAVSRAGGGGGGAAYWEGPAAGSGGVGGGGNGSKAQDGVGSNGQQNTGSGGGGGGGIGSGGSGGSGVIIIRASVAASSTTGSPTVSIVGSDTVYTFTGTGSIIF